MHLVLTNTPMGSGATLAEDLVRAGLAACVNIIPAVRSIYVTDGQLCDELEETLLIKVAEQGLEALRRELLARHPYELPELLVLPVDGEASSADFVAWVERSFRSA
jgi:periplasmic divalent cation tolerance protein